MQGFLEVTMTLLMEEWRGYDNVVDCTSTSSIEKEDATVPTFCLGIINGLDMRVMVSEFDSVHAIKMHNIVQKRFS